MGAACRESMEETERSSGKNRPKNPGAEGEGGFSGNNNSDYCLIEVDPLSNSIIFLDTDPQGQQGLNYLLLCHCVLLCLSS